MFKAIAISAACVTAFLGGVTVSRLPAKPETAEKTATPSYDRLETTVPILVDTLKTGYCEIDAMVAFSIDDRAFAESRLYDAVIRETVKNEEQGEAVCNALASFSNDEITVKASRYTPVK